MGVLHISAVIAQMVQATNEGSHFIHIKQSVLDEFEPDFIYSRTFPVVAGEEVHPQWGMALPGAQFKGYRSRRVGGSSAAVLAEVAKARQELATIPTIYPFSELDTVYESHIINTYDEHRHFITVNSDVASQSTDIREHLVAAYGVPYKNFKNVLAFGTEQELLNDELLKPFLGPDTALSSYLLYEL